MGIFLVTKCLLHSVVVIDSCVTKVVDKIEYMKGYIDLSGWNIRYSTHFISGSNFEMQAFIKD